MNKIMVGMLVAAIAAGCISVNKNDGGNSYIKPCQIKDKVHVKYTVDKNTVTAKDQMHCLFGFICWGSTASHNADQGEGGLTISSKVKNGAYANACDAAKCDQIAAARYKVTTKDYFVYQKCDAEVTGYPVKVTDVEVVDIVKNPQFYTGDKSSSSSSAGAASILSILK
jgi:hypothetical protein